MTKFAGDSIISAYVNMLEWVKWTPFLLFTFNTVKEILFWIYSKTQSNHKLPEYSEIYLRLAFKEVNGKNHVSFLPINSNVF